MSQAQLSHRIHVWRARKGVWVCFSLKIPQRCKWVREGRFFSSKMSEFSSHIEKTKRNVSSGEAAQTHSSLHTSAATGATGEGRALLHKPSKTRPSSSDCRHLNICTGVLFSSCPSTSTARSLGVGSQDLLTPGWKQLRGGRCFGLAGWRLPAEDAMGQDA